MNEIKYKLEVTQDDLDRGRPLNTSECAISLAARRLFPEAILVHTRYHSIHVQTTDTDLYLTASRRLKRLVRQFDADRSQAKPGRFILSLDARYPRTIKPDSPF